MKMALGQATNENSPKSENVAMVSHGNQKIWTFGLNLALVGLMWENILSQNVIKGGLKNARMFFGKPRLTSFYPISMVMPEESVK